MKRVLATFACAGILAFALALLAHLRARGVDDVPAATVAWIAAFVLLVALERLAPWERAWHAPDGQLLHDFAHTLLGSALGSRLGGLAAGLLLELVVIDAMGAGGRWWPGDAPMWQQVALAYLAIDLTRYGQHRLQHRVPFLWATHELHHDPGRLIALKAGRAHILDRAQQALCVLPVAALGAPVDVLFWCVAANSLIGLTAHANVDVALGPVGAVFVGPAQHRVHHALVAPDGARNFGASLVVWDRLFGTFAARDVRAVGVPAATPARLLAQLAAPLAAWTGGAHPRRGGDEGPTRARG